MYLNNEKYFNKTIAMLLHFIQNIFSMYKNFNFCHKYKLKSLQNGFMVLIA